MTHRSLLCLGFVLFATHAATSVAAIPKVGDKAPDFTLGQIDGRKLTLSAELKSGPVVLIVGRGWVGYQCPFCNRQFGDFLKAAADIEAAGARVVWVYPGPAEDVQKRAEEFAAGKPFPPNFRFVLDPNYAFTRSYDLRWDAPQETAYPSTFVIDRAGVVRYALVSKSHGGRATAADVLACLRAWSPRPSSRR
ncbi:MAG TPA: redoxin family protein [Vicinamibacterales bacterium]|nr:redoxin family protein [Vicinamibacterales bacterium]